MTWSIKNYNAFLRESRTVTGASLTEARETYRQMRDLLKRSAIGRDVSKHPRIHKRAYERAQTIVEEKRVEDLESWLDTVEEADDTEQVEAEGTATYAKA